MRTSSLLILLFIGAAPAYAHVGSPDVFYEGNAGPYHLFVTVRMPTVIPGLAQVEIRSPSSDVRSVQLTIRRLSGFGNSLHAIPDSAPRSTEDPTSFVGSLWVMETYDLQVRIEVDGVRGKAELGVPLPAFSQSTLRMQRALGVLLFCCMLFLAFGSVSIVGASVREGKLPTGVAPTKTDIRRARTAMFAASLLLLITIGLGNAWWRVDANASQSQSWSSNSPNALAMVQPDGSLLLRVQGRGELWAKYIKPENFIPDHGHLMHLFLIRLPYMDYMYHLHPERIEGGSFAEPLPTIPEGKYQIFADVVDDNGVPWTATGQIDLPNIAGVPLSGDDSQASGNPLASTKEDATSVQLSDGGRMIWERDTSPLRSNVPTSFRFRTEDRDGKAASDLEPYMGMSGHAVFVRSDSSVFAHVHPAGSISMAALQLAQASLLPVPPRVNDPLSGNQVSDHVGMGMTTSASPQISFPYGFPKAGLYRIFVQVKRSGHVQTGIFDAHVE